MGPLSARAFMLHQLCSPRLGGLVWVCRHLLGVEGWVTLAGSDYWELDCFLLCHQSSKLALWVSQGSGFQIQVPEQSWRIGDKAKAVSKDVAAPEIYWWFAAPREGADGMAQLWQCESCWLKWEMCLNGMSVSTILEPFQFVSGMLRSIQHKIDICLRSAYLPAGTCTRAYLEQTNSQVFSYLKTGDSPEIVFGGIWELFE